ncbi:MAG: hypothetical protein BXU00_00765 [Candidatus Nanoclepta minutus]|uniref:FAD-binding domain-containing protein n=1 Tax=Candidatus Nanoclepta minutus TaxID=1940235 RepID=A0A397WQ45_9ARCH|nr:MAG: hypothetical protein BXU00_00765 [Candidatus Nanoclepta minutus]
MSLETSDVDVLIVGSGVSGLFLSNFLSKLNVDFILIDSLKDPINRIRDTGLVSENFVNLFPKAKDFAIKSYRSANFYLGKDSFEVFARRGNYYLLDRVALNKHLLESAEKYGEVSFGERLERINGYAITNYRKIRYKVIVDATGPYSYVRKLYDLESNKDFVIGIEIHTEDLLADGIHIFLDKKYSKEHFLWIVGLDGYSKVGIMDKGLNMRKFLKIIRDFGIYDYSLIYSHVIKRREEKVLAYKNFISVGESTGYLKKFSLGGILVSYIQAYFASLVIKGYLEKGIPLERYNKIIKDYFYVRSFPDFVRKAMKKKAIFNILKVLNANKIVSYFDLDFYIPFYRIKSIRVFESDL